MHLEAQVAVVWAKDEAGEIRGLIVERGMEGFTTPEIHGNGVCVRAALVN